MPIAKHLLLLVIVVFLITSCKTNPPIIPVIIPVQRPLATDSVSAKAAIDTRLAVKIRFSIIKRFNKSRSFII